MNANGHHRVAARVLDAVGAGAPEEWWHARDTPESEPLSTAAYYRRHVGPWIKRRVTRRSSGDGRRPKFADWTEVRPSEG